SATPLIVKDDIIDVFDYRLKELLKNSPKVLGANLDYPTLYWSKRTPPGAQVFFHRGGLGLAMGVRDGLE
ncbi:MAG: hypothetical protein V3V47_06935, partial [Desulfobacteria bacterium]